MRRFSVTFLFLMCGLVGVSHGDPLTTILGLAAADRLTQKGEQNAEEVIPWRERLSNGETGILDRMGDHPAVGACTRAADAGDPIATYNLRKLAEFSLDIRRFIRKNEYFPDVGQLEHQRPAKAFKWCSRKAGLHDGDQRGSLTQYAKGLARLAASHDHRQGLTASRTIP